MAYRIPTDLLSYFFKDILRRKETRRTPKGTINVNTIFILSAGRTGTHFLQQFFNTCFQDVYAVHEPHPDLFELGMQKIRSDLSSEAICEKIKDYRVRFLEKNLFHGTGTYIESNPHAAYLIPELMDTFGFVKFLYVVRNPIDSARSFYAKSPVKNGGQMLFYGENDHRKRISPMDFRDDKWEREWPYFSRVHKIAWYWNKVNSIIQDSLQTKENTLQVKYEDFFSENQSTRKSTILQVVDFLELAENRVADWNKINGATGQKSNATKVDFLPPFEQWPIKEKEKFMELTAIMRMRLGYPL